MKETNDGIKHKTVRQAFDKTEEYTVSLTASGLK
jgi:hypothetical protein